MGGLLNGLEAFELAPADPESGILAGLPLGGRVGRPELPPESFRGLLFVVRPFDVLESVSDSVPSSELLPVEAFDATFPAGVLRPPRSLPGAPALAFLPLPPFCGGGAVFSLSVWGELADEDPLTPSTTPPRLAVAPAAPAAGRGFLCLTASAGLLRPSASALTSTAPAPADEFLARAPAEAPSSPPVCRWSQAVFNLYLGQLLLLLVDLLLLAGALTPAPVASAADPAGRIGELLEESFFSTLMAGVGRVSTGVGV